MFNTVAPADPDAILGLTEAFKRDPDPQKINLGVGVYRDPDGRTPILPVVKEAERRLLESRSTKSYKPIAGDPEYGERVRELVLGADHPTLREGRAASAHTPGGTGALRVAGDYLKRVHGEPTVWLSDPTWGNHRQVFAAAGLDTRSYPYFDPGTNGLAFEQMMRTLEGVGSGDVVVLHACCHNPTGVDPTEQQWERIAQALTRRGALPLVDFAYQGFDQGLDGDAAGLRQLARTCPEMLICNSFSKNFGLYNERVGGLTVIAETSGAAEAVLSRAKRVIRANYSNPPAHGGEIVTTILSDDPLRAQWESELSAMRERIRRMRRLFAQTLEAKGVEGKGGEGDGWGFITRQRGMFSFSRLGPEQVEWLRREHSIYIVGSGRINVAGMSETNMDRLCEAIGEVV